MTAKFNGEKKINLRLAKGADKPLDINPDEIPTMIPSKVFNEISSGDSAPYFKIQRIEYPIKANGWNYLESFFESFLKKLKQRPFPGSKSGHNMSYGARGNTDLYLVGGRVDAKGDGTGVVYLKNYIPPMGDNGSPNDRFILDNKAGLVDYSLVSYTKDERIDGTDGEVEYNVIESMFGERNDAVEYGTGAMEQKTNKDNPLGDEGENKTTGEGMLKKNEILDALKTLKDNAEITLGETAKAMGLEGQVVTEVHTNAVSAMKAINELLGDDPVAAIKTMQTQLKENESESFNAKMTNAFGAEKHNNGEENLLRSYAAGKLKDVKLNELDAKIEEIKNDPVAKKLSADLADENSSSNRLVVDQNGKANSADGPESVEY